MNRLLEKTYSVREAAMILKVHPLTVRRKLASKKLAYYKFDGKIEISESHLKDYIAQAEVKATNDGRI